MSHKITYTDLKQAPPNRVARCRCGWSCKPQITLQNAEDEAAGHEREVERLQLMLGTRTPTLKAQWDYYREMSVHPDVDEKDRVLWRQLASELEPRVKDKKDRSVDVALPFD